MKKNQLKIGTVLSFVSLVVGNLISIIYTPIMLRLLGQSEYGLYNLVSSIISYLSLLNFGFGSAYIRYYLRYKVKEDRDNIAKLNGMFFILFSFIALVAISIGLLMATNVSIIFGSELSISELATARVLMTLLSLNMGISLPNVVFTSYLTANEEFIFLKSIQIVKNIANPILTIPVLILGYGSIGLVTITTILTVFVEVCYASYSFKKLNMSFTFKGLDMSLMKEMFIFSSYIFTNMVIDQINWNVDKYILGRYHGTISVAIYGLASQLNSYYQILSTTISRMFVPRINKIVSTTNNNQELTMLFTKIGRIQFMILALISTGFIFFGRPFLVFWAGEEYYESYYIALLLIIPITIPLIQNIGIEIQQAKNMHQFRSMTYIFIAILNLIITIPLSRVLGGTGAAIGTAFSLIIGNGLLMNWYYHNKVGIDMSYFWKNILDFSPALISPVALGVIINFVLNIDTYLKFITFGFIYVVIYILSFWFIGINYSERKLILSPIRKIVNRINK